ncbi:MAG: beta-ketoacyl synthase N-terminal-like domain-containing protein, partial [Mucilaginibacter sp.]
MMKPDVFIVADNILSPLGKTTEENFEHLKNNESGVKCHDNERLSPVPFFAALFDDGVQFLQVGDEYTKFEQLLIASITDALKNVDIDPKDKKTALIISSTKGNINLLETEENNPALQQRVAMPTSAKMVAEHFGFQNQPIIISNACISGVMAIITGMRLLNAGQYENAV